MSRPDRDRPLAGKTALVSGGSRGIGAAIAQHLAERGAQVAINHRNNPALAEALADQIEADTQLRPLVVQADLADPGACRAAVEQTRAHFGGLDILVHNAGIQRIARVSEMTDDDWLAVVSVNLNAAFFLAQAALPSMRAGGWGRIVNISSASAFHTHAGISSYVASKQGLIGLTKALAVEFARHGITVNAIAPGLTDTDMIAGLSDAQREATLTQIPMRRMAAPREIAELVAWVVESANYSTGNVFHASGGVVMG